MFDLLGGGRRLRHVEAELAAVGRGRGLQAFDETYLQLAHEDFQSSLELVVELSRPVDRVTWLDRISYRITDDLGFDAAVEPSGPGSVTIVISTGTLLALEDLCYRVSANADFFTFDEESGTRLWAGCECLWFNPIGSAFPRRRFIDYGLGQVQQERSGTSLARFLEVLPLDLERQQLASVMFHVGLLWLVLHEQGHFIEGHVDFMNAQLIRDNRLGIHETGTQRLPDGKNATVSLESVLEWQADRIATRGTFDVFFKTECFRWLPGYCEDAPSWDLRLFLDAIGIVVHLLQKGRICAGAPDDAYPTPRTRLLAAIRVAIAKMWNLVPGTRYEFSLWKTACELSMQSIKGSLEDLNAVSNLITRDMPTTDWTASAVGGRAPLAQSSHGQGLLDSPSELRWVARMLVFSELSPADWDAHLSVLPTPWRDLTEKWWGQHNAIVWRHNAEVWDLMRPHRRAVGNFLE